MTLTVAVGELTRVLPWSLRALGYPFGTADRAAHVIAKAAALDPSVLDRIAGAGQWPEGGVCLIRDPAGLHVEAHGCSLFEVGPVVVDYLAAHVQEAPVVAANVTGATDLELLPAIADIGAGYGLTLVILEPDKRGGGWIATGPDLGRHGLLSGTDITDLLAGVQHDALAGKIKSADAGKGLVFLATEQPVRLTFETPGVDTDKALATANAKGIPISKDTLEALYALEMITWAPTSERSRAQAGFTPKAAPA